MKKFAFLATLACLCASAYGADGASLYKKCIACHGPTGEKVYLNKVPALKTMSSADRVQYMKDYIAGTRNAYGQGAIMRINLKGWSEEDIRAVDEYISTFK